MIFEIYVIIAILTNHFYEMGVIDGLSNLVVVDNNAFLVESKR